MTEAADPAAVADYVATCFRAGLLTNEAKVVGCWYVVGTPGYDGGDPDEVGAPLTLHLTYRTNDGRFLSGVHGRWFPFDEYDMRDELDAVERDEPDVDAFCSALFHVAWTLGFGGAPLMYRTSLVDGMVVAVERRFGAVDRAAVREASERALAGIGAVLAEYLDAVDVNATSAMDRCQWEPGQVDAIAHWRPLVESLHVRPALAQTFLNAWTRDVAAFRRDHAAGGADGALAGHLARVHGMSAAGAGRAMRMSADGRLLDALSRGVMIHEVEECLTESPVTVLAAALELVPSDWQPRDLSGTVAFSACASAVRTSSRWCADPRDLHRLLNAKGRWDEFGARLRRVARVADLNVVLYEPGNFAERLCEQVLAPSIMLAHGAAPWDALEGADDAHLRRVARHLLHSGSTLPAIVEAAYAWRRDESRVSSVAAGLGGAHSEGIRWEAGFPSVRDGDVSIDVLTTPRGLRDEGCAGEDGAGVRGLGHCVGGYAAHCMSGAVRILSVSERTPSGAVRRLSTAELRVDDGVIRLTQHKGDRNGPPPAKAQRALGFYLDAITAERLRVQVGALAGDARAASAMLVAGYDWSEPGNVEAVIRAWEPHLPRRLRGLYPADWAALAAVPMPERGWWRPDPVVPGRGD